MTNTIRGRPMTRRRPLCAGLQKRVRNRKPTLGSVAKQAANAGIEVARYEVDANGKIIVVTRMPITSSVTETDLDKWD